MGDQPPSNLDPAIRAYYDSAPEESRLEIGAFRLEELRTRELIVRHAPEPPAVVVDVGGAAGAYAFWLAERGYDVRLFDAVPRLVGVAQRRNEHARHRLTACTVADARALPAANESAAMVLLLGPLYHLVHEHHRQAALSEAFRLLRPGGILIAAGIARWASALDGLARELLSDPGFAGIVEQDLLDGQHRNPTQRLDYFTTAYFHRPEDLRREVVDAGLEVEGLYGVEGPGWILPDLAERWNEPERRDMLLQVARMLESEPSVLGCSAHLIVVGRKKAHMREVEVFGRRLLVERTTAGWQAYVPGEDGKRRPLPGVLIPGFIVTDDELLQYLADLLHESARPDRRDVRWIR